MVRQVPGADRQSELAADAVVGPDLRSMYLPSPAAGCDAGWTQVDLASGRRQPAFARPDRDRGVQPERRRPDPGLPPHHRPRDPGSGAIRHELPDRAGRQRADQRPPAGMDDPAGRDGAGAPAEPGRDPAGLPTGTDARRGHPAPPAPTRRHTTSVTDGHDLPAAGDCPMSMWRFLDRQRLLALGCAAEPFDNLLARIDLETRRVLSSVPLGLPVELFSLVVDRSGRHVLITAAESPTTSGRRPRTCWATAAPSGRRSTATAGRRTGNHRSAAA